MILLIAFIMVLNIILDILWQLEIKIKNMLLKIIRPDKFKVAVDNKKLLSRIIEERGSPYYMLDVESNNKGAIKLEG